MAEPNPPAQALAAKLAGAWHLDADPDDAVLAPDPGAFPALPADTTARLFPRAVVPADAPPSLERILEALLFTGGPPLSAAAAQHAVRGLTPDRFHAAVDDLNRRYRSQKRPYSVVPAADGYQLALRPGYTQVRAKLAAGPREVRLTQPALDALSVVAYRQPVSKADIDTARGADSASPVRQLVRLGLIAASPNGYVTTARFLDLMGFDTLADLPKLGESRVVL